MKPTARFLFLGLIIFSPILVFAQTDYTRQLKRLDDLLKAKQFEQAINLADSLTDVIDPNANSKQFLLATTKQIQAYTKSGSYTEATKVGDRLISSYPDMLQSSLRIASEFYLQLGLAYHLTQSNESKGLSYLNQAMSLFKQSGDKDRVFESNILGSLARSYYYQGKYDTSIAMMQKRMKLLDANKDKEELALSLRSIGNSYWGLQQYDQAAAFYNKSLDVLYSDDPVDSLRIGQVLHAKGYIHMDQEDYQQAYETFAKASGLLEKRNQAVSSPMVWVYGDVGRALIDLEQYDESLIWLQKALNANVFEYQQDDYYQNPPLKNINDDFQHFMILKLKGQAFQRKYLDSEDQEDLKGMIDCFRLADQQIDNIRKTLPKAEDQSSISYYSTELYSKAIASLVKVYNINPDPSFLELAHYFMEKVKITRVQLKFLEASAKANKLLPDEMLEEDQKLLDEITSLKTKMLEHLKDEGDSASILQNQLFELEENYERFIAEIEANYPAYHNSRFNLQVTSVSDVQQFLQNQSSKRAIVSYYNFGDELWTSIITKDTIAFTGTRNANELEDTAGKIRESLTNPNEELTGLDSLSQLLLGGISNLLDGTTAITFILDPALQLVPMELLQLNDNYLFETHDIGYHFSATMFIQQDGNQYNSTDFAGFAPSFDSLSLTTLPGARVEVESISKVLAGSTFIGDDATEKSLKNSITDIGLIHLATHAVIDESNPESSFLQFSGSSDEDGKLHFFEIYGLDINAQLITLSACNTGYGKVQRGEGVMSLSRAFAYAGVPATVVSLWPASDKSTPELMKFFYQNLSEGQDKDKALNNARKAYLATAKGKARHPFYWAGFVIIGDNSPIESGRNLLVYLIPSLIVIVMILTIYIRKKKSN